MLVVVQAHSTDFVTRSQPTSLRDSALTLSSVSDRVHQVLPRPHARCDTALTFMHPFLVSLCLALPVPLHSLSLAPESSVFDVSRDPS